jgi:hypothetical protein
MVGDVLVEIGYNEWDEEHTRQHMEKTQYNACAHVGC